MGTLDPGVGPYTGYAGNDMEIWTGVVTVTGASTVVVSFSASVTSVHTGLADQEFTDLAEFVADLEPRHRGRDLRTPRRPRSPSPSSPRPEPESSTSATGRWPTPGRAGTTSGFTYTATSDADVGVYATTVSAAVQPTAKQSPAGVSGAVGFS